MEAAAPTSAKAGDEKPVQENHCGRKPLQFFEQAKSVIIAQVTAWLPRKPNHALRELADKLKSKRRECENAIHPVAGRMPGHMNV